MSDRFVTIASFAFPPEAQMAKNLLESEGIPAILSGEMTATTLTGVLGQAGEVHLQVRDQDAGRAVSLLASVSAQASLDEDWETQAEAGLCVCSVCGMAVPRTESACPACGTPNERITTDRRNTWPAPARRPDSEAVKKNDQVQASAPGPVNPEPAGTPEPVPARGRSGCAVLLIALLVVPVWLLWT
jgi:hypothetical protein